MQVNRLGKVILESGYKSIKDFKVKNELTIAYSTLYMWCTKCVKEPKIVLYPRVDELAKVLGTSRNDILDMIASNAVFEINPSKIKALIKGEDHNILKAKRAELGFTARELAEYIGLGSEPADVQVIHDIENGKRISFPSNESFSKYLEALDMSFTQFQSAIRALANKRNAERVIERMSRDGEPVPEVPEDQSEPVVVVPLPGVGATPVGYETKPIEPSEKRGEIMRLIYGQVNYDTFLAVSDALREAGI